MREGGAGIWDYGEMGGCVGLAVGDLVHFASIGMVARAYKVLKEDLGFRVESRVTII